MTQQKHPIEDLDFGVMGISTYKGCIVSKIIGGYSIFGTKCKTPEEVDLAIENAGNWLEGSIKVVNNGSMACGNGANLQENTPSGTMYPPEQI